MNLEALRQFKPQIQALAMQYHIDPDSIRVFGSVARGEPDPRDVDFLVHPMENCSLFDLGGFLHDASVLTGTQTDVACDTGTNRRFFKIIEDDIVFL